MKKIEIEIWFFISILVTIIITMFIFAGVFLIYYPVKENGFDIITPLIGVVGAIIGGVISGGLTVLGVFLGFKLERKKSLIERYHSEYSQLIEFEEWLEENDDVLSFFKTNNEEEKFTDLSAKNKKQEGKEYEKILARLDIELFELIKEYNYNLAWFFLNIQMSKSDDEMNANYAKKQIDKDANEVKKYHKKIIERLNVIKNEANK